MNQQDKNYFMKSNETCFYKFHSVDVFQFIKL